MTEILTELPESKHPWQMMPREDGILCINPEHEPRIVYFDGTAEVLTYQIDLEECIADVAD